MAPIRSVAAPVHGQAAHCAELLAPLGAIQVRRMFGGQGLYVDGLIVALVIDECLYLKIDEASRGAFESAGGRPFQYEVPGRTVTVSYWTVPDEALDTPAAMGPWARLALDAALRARAHKALPVPTGAARRPPARKRAQAAR
jgi:DNA transformation protein and related proteins